jgi:hypothetical protein
VLVYHIREAQFKLCVKYFCFFLVYKGPVLFIVVNVAVIENLIVFAIEIDLILSSTLLAQINERILIGKLRESIVFEVE